MARSNRGRHGGLDPYNRFRKGKYVTLMAIWERLLAELWGKYPDLGDVRNFMVLCALNEVCRLNDKPKIKYVADLTGLYYTTAWRRMKKLEGLGYVEHFGLGKWQLTAKGRALIGYFNRIVFNWLQKGIIGYNAMRKPVSWVNVDLI